MGEPRKIDGQQAGRRIRAEIERIRTALDLVEQELAALEEAPPRAAVRARPERYYLLLVEVYERGPHGVSPDQLAHLIACFQKVKQTKPEWVTTEIALAVMTELKRAKRPGDETAVYRELVTSAGTVEQVRIALGIAADRNDLETALDLFARLERLQPPVGAASSLAQLPTRQAWPMMLAVSIVRDSGLQ